MNYWRKESFESLSEIARSKKAMNEFKLYAQYCEQREKGLRKASIETLRSFISEALRWPEEKKFHFISWLYSVSNEKSFINELIPEILYQDFINPVLNLWVEREPNNTEPLRLINTFDSLRKAIKLDCFDENLIEKFVKKTISQVEMSTHELPQYDYSGNIEFEIDLLQDCVLFIKRLDSKNMKIYLKKIILLKNLLNSWRDFKSSNSEMKFKDWAIKESRIYEVE